MDALFLAKLALSFVFGGIWVTIATIIADKFGSKVGGLIGGIPSTAVITLFFVGLTQSPLVASKATNMLPIFIALNGVFLIIYALLIRKNVFIALFSSLFAWIALASVVVLSKYVNFTLASIIWILSIPLSYYIMEKTIKIKSLKKSKIKYKSWQIIARAILSGSIISIGVIMAKIGGAVFGGIFSAFPSLFISTLIITYMSGGAEFSRSITKTLMISGMINVGIYGICVRYFYLLIGLYFGTLISFSISLISAYLTYNFIIKRMN